MLHRYKSFGKLNHRSHRYKFLKQRTTCHNGMTGRTKIERKQCFWVYMAFYLQYVEVSGFVDLHEPTAWYYLLQEEDTNRWCHPLLTMLSPCTASITALPHRLIDIWLGQTVTFWDRDPRCCSASWYRQKNTQGEVYTLHVPGDVDHVYCSDLNKHNLTGIFCHNYENNFAITMTIRCSNKHRPHEWY